MHREKQSIIFNLFLYGPPGCGRNTFLQWIVQNENLLDANFLRAIKTQQEHIRTQLNSYMKTLKDLPGTIKHNLQNFIQQETFEEAKTYFEISSYRIRQLCKAYDEELNRTIKKAITNLQKSAESTVKTSKTFSYLDLVGSSSNLIYRIHYSNYSDPTPIDLSSFLPQIDGLIFIWDCQQRIEENIRVFELVTDNLPPDTQTPLVIALNKVDLPHNINSTDIQQLLSQARYEKKLQTTLYSDAVIKELSIFETVATQGSNIKRIIRNLVLMIGVKNQTEIAKLRNLLIQEVQP